MPWPLGVSVLAPVVLIAHSAGSLRLAAQSLAAALVKLAAMPANANSESCKIAKNRGIRKVLGSGNVWYKTITWSTLPPNSDIPPLIGSFTSDEPRRNTLVDFMWREEILPSVIRTLNSPLMRNSPTRISQEKKKRKSNYPHKDTEASNCDSHSESSPEW